MMLCPVVVYCKSYHTARVRYPDAFRICKVEGGFMCFPDRDSYRLWRNQKER